MDIRVIVKKAALFLVLVGVGSNVSAFQISPADCGLTDEQLAKIPVENRSKIKMRREKLYDMVKGYEIEFQNNPAAMVIKCPHDGGTSEFDITRKNPKLIKSTDICKHEVIFKAKEGAVEMQIYKDDIPLLLADDYCSWRYGTQRIIRNVWEKYSILQRVQQKKSKPRA